MSIFFHKLQQCLMCNNNLLPWNHHIHETDTSSFEKDHYPAGLFAKWNLRQEQDWLSISIPLIFQHLCLLSTNEELPHGRRGSWAASWQSPAEARSRSGQGTHLDRFPASIEASGLVKLSRSNPPLSGNRCSPPPRSRWHCCWKADSPFQPSKETIKSWNYFTLTCKRWRHWLPCPPGGLHLSRALQ